MTSYEYDPHEIAALGYDPSDDKYAPDGNAYDFYVSGDAAAGPRDRRTTRMVNSRAWEAMSANVTNAGRSWEGIGEGHSESLREHVRDAGQRSRIPMDHDGTLTGFMPGGVQYGRHTQTSDALDSRTGDEETHYIRDTRTAKEWRKLHDDVRRGLGWDRNRI